MVVRPIGKMSWFWKMSGAVRRHKSAVIMVGGGNRISVVLVIEGSNDWVLLLLIVFDLPGESVDEDTDGVDKGGSVSAISLANWKFSDEISESPDRDSESDGSGDGGSARCLCAVATCRQNFKTSRRIYHSTILSHTTYKIYDNKLTSITNLNFVNYPANYC